MRGVFLAYVPSSDGQRKLVPRLEDHVILPDVGEVQVLVQVKACSLERIDVKTISELSPTLEQIPVGHHISGVVSKVGSAVRSFVVGEEVVGELPMDSECPGCAEYCCLPEYCLVTKPACLSHVDCAAGLGPGLRAITALHHLARLQTRASVLVCSATTSDGLAVIQLCESLQAKVIATVSSADEAAVLRTMHPSLLRVIDLSSSQNLVEVCLAETSGLGVDCVIDSGVTSDHFLSDFLIESAHLRKQLEQEANRHSYETSSCSAVVPSKHQLVSCLAVHGRWVTSQPDLQLDPPDSQLLFLKGASLHFLFPGCWGLSGARQGAFLTLLSSVVAKLESGLLEPYVFKTLVLEQACEELPRLASHQVGGVVVRTEGLK